MALTVTVTDVRVHSAVLSGSIDAPMLGIALDWLDAQGNVVSSTVDNNPVPAPLIGPYQQFLASWIQLYKQRVGITS